MEGVKLLAFQNKDIDMDNICNKLKYETLPIKYTAGLFLACNILYQIVKAMIHHWFRFETSPSSFVLGTEAYSVSRNLFFQNYSLSLGSSRQSYISYLNLEIL